MAANRGHQKRLEKKKKQRELAKRAQRTAAMGRPTSSAGLLRLAPSLPFGPAFMSATWRDGDLEEPSLVSVVITRVTEDGQLLAAILLVDRTCLGVKDAFAAPPMTRGELDVQLERLERIHGAPMEEVQVLEALSVVYHAIDFAASFAFDPHRDFPASIVGPRPEELLETPLAHPSEPVYLSGPNDDAEAIRAQLEAAADAPVEIIV